MTGVFYGCSSLTSIALTNYLINITSLNDLFGKCSSLEKVTINVQRVQSVNGMFKDCFNLKYLDLSNFNANEIKLRTDFFPTEITGLTVIYNSSLFENIKNFIPRDGTIFHDIEGYNGFIKAKYIIDDLSKKIKIINTPVDKLKLSVFVNNSKIMDLKEGETEIFFDEMWKSEIKIKYSGNLTNLFSLFSDVINLEEINMNDLDVNEVENMEKLFNGCTSLKEVNMNLLKTPKLMNINSMFENCENLKIIYMQNFNTNNLITAKSAFENCFSLEKIYINNFDLTKITDASHMFYQCNSLKEIALKNDNIGSSQINIKSIFNGCYSLERIILNNFNKKIITDISYAFNDCRSLKSIDLSKFDTSKVSSIYSMFSNCYSLSSIDITSFDLSNTDSFSYAFRNCTSLKSIDLSKFNTNKAETMTGVFYGCSSLTSIELNNYLINITSLNDLFGKCSSLENVIINVQRVKSVSGMFKDCLNLKYLDLSNFNANEIIIRTDFFPTEISNVTIVYNSSIFENITKFIPNEGIKFIDINENKEFN